VERLSLLLVWTESLLLTVQVDWATKSQVLTRSFLLGVWELQLEELALLSSGEVREKLLFWIKAYVLQRLEI